MLTIIINKIRSIISSNSLKQSFLFTFILNKLDLNVTGESSSEAQFAFGILIMSLICLLSFINVTGYLFSFYLLNKYDVDIKYPKFKKIIHYYEKSSLFFVVLEGIMCVVFLLAIIYLSYLTILYK